jgi:hypothetical protein
MAAFGVIGAPVTYVCLAPMVIDHLRVRSLPSIAKARSTDIRSNRVAELRLTPETSIRKHQGQLSHVPLRAVQEGRLIAVRCHPFSLSNPKSTIKSIERVR